MKAFSFTLLVVYLMSLASAYVDLCVDRFGPQVERFEASQDIMCDDQDADSAVNNNCCDTGDNDSSQGCGSCPCLCHAVAAAPGNLVLTPISPSTLTLDPSFSVISIHLFRIDRPPRLS